MKIPTAIAKTLGAAALLAAAWIPAAAQRTTSPRLRPAVATADSRAEQRLDTLSLAADTAAARFYGYEKTLRATRETLFLRNNTGRDASEVRFTIVYLDAAGREIHRRRVARRAEIPAGKTVRLDIPSWDTQKTYYYRGGPRPRVTATPYTVSVIPDTLILLPARSVTHPSPED